MAYIRPSGEGVIPLAQPQPTRARFLTVAEVADQLRVSNMTVYRLIHGGELPAVRVGKSYRLREDDVDKYLADRYTEAGWAQLPRYDTVSFLSDYGTADEFVGVVKSVIRGIAPHVSVIDVTHHIPPHDLRAGGLALVRAVQYLAPGVVLAVVDPGVGTDRRAVAVEVGDGQAVFVGPDNGLLAPAVAMTGGAGRAVSLTNDDYHLAAPGPTFAGRDVFAPVAAHLSAGVDLAELGDLIDPVTMTPGLLPITREESDGLVAEVLWVDHFGNAQLNVDPDEIEAFGERVALRWGEQRRTARRARTYGDLKPGEIGLVVDSYGLVSIAFDRRSAADELGLRSGDAVTLGEAV